MFNIVRLVNNRSFNLVRHFAKVPFILADIGEGIKEVEILEWKVKPGQKVARFDPLCDVQSDKATVTISSRYDGVVESFAYKKGDTAEVGKPLLYLDSNDEAAIKAAEAQPKHEQPPPKSQPQSPPQPTQQADPTQPITVQPTQQPVQTNNNRQILIIPQLRKYAKDNNIDLTQINGTGKDGRILLIDIDNYINNLKQKASIKEADTIKQPQQPQQQTIHNEDWVEPLSGIKKIMFKTISGSLTIPHCCYHEDVVIDELMNLRAFLKTSKLYKDLKISYMPFVIKATSLALKEYPIFNSSVNYEKNEIVYHSNHNIGIAMDTPRGLLVPVIKSVQDKNIIDLSNDLRRLQDLGSKNQLGVNELEGATFTISNIGAIGGTYAFPLITPPQVGIALLGKTTKLPKLLDDGKIVPYSNMPISLSADHRVIDGATMARFIVKLKTFIETPSLMLTELK